MKKILLFTLFPFFLQAQTVPGYLGKMNVLSFESYFMSTFYPLSSKIVDENLGISSKFGLSWDHTFSKKYAFCLSTNYFRAYEFSSGSVTYFDDNNESYEVKTLGNPKINSWGFSLGLKRYSRHYSPLGKHFEIRALVRNSFADGLKLEDSSKNRPDREFTHFGIGAGFNLSHALNDNYLITYGGNINAYYIKLDSTEFRILMKEFLSFKIAVGYIL